MHLFEDGSIFTTDKPMESARTVKFSTYRLTIDASDLMASASSREKGRKELGIREILQRLKRGPGSGLGYNEVAVEFMERFSIPAAVFLMGLIGVPLGAQIRSGGRLMGVVVSLLIFLLYYLSLVGMRNIGETGMLSPFVTPWVPVILLGAILAFLIRKASRDEPFRFLNRIAALRES